MIGTQLEEAFAQQLKQEVTDFLLKLVNIRSYPNEEQEAAQFCFNSFAGLDNVIVKKLFMDNSLKDNPLWCCGPFGNNDYTGHFNVEAVWKGTGEQEPIYLNAHMDTVPAGEEDVHLLSPVLKDGIIYGLGACDDKGPIASIYTIFLILSRLNISLPFDVVAHMVAEEEIGGNGALAVTRNKNYKGQAAIVLEPTAGSILPVHRCGLWIKITCHGSACHTAAMQSGRGLSSFNLMLKAHATIKEVHDAYREECRLNPVKYYEDYLPPLNVGVVHLGDYPSKVPPKAVLLASVAVLPNSNNEEMKEKIRKAFEKDKDLRDNVEIEFVFDRGSSVRDFDDPFVVEFSECVKANGYSGKIESMKALSDMYFYQEVLGIPTVTFGPGDLMDAHSATEKVAIADVIKSAKAIFDWLQVRARKQEKE